MNFRKVVLIDPRAVITLKTYTNEMNLELI